MVSAGMSWEAERSISIRQEISESEILRLAPHDGEPSRA